MNTDIGKVSLWLKLEFKGMEEALLAKQRLGEYFKNIQLKVEKQNVKRKFERHKFILEKMYRSAEPIKIGILWRRIRPDVAISYKQFSRDVSELILKGELIGERRTGAGGNTTILRVIRHEGNKRK